jgi:hypothetical protein
VTLLITCLVNLVSQAIVPEGTTLQVEHRKSDFCGKPDDWYDRIYEYDMHITKYVCIYILTQPYLPQKDAKIRSNSRVWSDPQKDGELKRLTVFLFRRAISI